MMSRLFDLARPLLFAFDPEDAHELTLRSLELGVYPRCAGPDAASLAVRLWGLDFPNPLGVAAGFDKDARVPDAVLGMGCGFAEIGTTTPLAQAGNPRPRVFRLAEDHAVINRLGFNNEGHAAALARLSARGQGGLVGVNIGANKDSTDRIADYVAGLRTFYDAASYFMVNISSPNTPGLRDLQTPDALDRLLTALTATRRELIASGKPSRALIVKVASDLADEQIEPMASMLMSHGVDGIAVSNTTVDRTGLLSASAGESGGLSGRPLFHRSTVMLARMHQATGGRVPLIGIGGIDSPAAALAKIEAGASLIQIYTGLVYEGPGLIRRIKDALAKELSERGIAAVATLAGVRAKDWAARPLT